MLNKQPRTADKGFRRGAPYCENISMLLKIHRQNLGPGGKGRGAACTGVWWGKPEGKRPMGRPRYRWEDNIKAGLHEVVCGGMD
jgi:hypothetical protein